MRRLALLAALLGGCTTYHLDVSPIPVVVSFGGYTPDKQLVAGAPAPVDHGIPNLRQVDPGIWRGGQPTAEGWAWLVSQGVHTSVKLNYEPEGAPASVHVVVCSMPPETFWDAEKEPDPAAVARALAALDAGGGVFVHCDHGQDRTGLIIALYRVRHDHWPRSRAWREMLADGYHRIFLGLDDVWEDWR